MDFERFGWAKDEYNGVWRFGNRYKDGQSMQDSFEVVKMDSKMWALLWMSAPRYSHFSSLQFDCS